MMHRFFVPPQTLQTDPLLFPPETAHQISAVLHLKPGQNVVLLDNSGSEFEVELLTVGTKVALGKIVQARPAAGEPAVQVILYLALTQREKFEWALQKCTEVGAAGFVPVITSRSLVQSTVEARSKYERWQKILQEAAEQSGRGLIPTLFEPLRFGQALAHARQNTGVSLIPWEKEENVSLRAALAQIGAATRIGVFIGPEGGFSGDEIALACQTGALPVTLGRRILRMETAAVVSAALILDFYGG
jgi:16S rRNA (uracil1498-N3)-methyltransferase